MSSYEELKAAAENGATDIIITADITYPEDAETVMFDHAIALQSADGEHYTIDGNGHQIIAVASTSFMENLGKYVVEGTIKIMNLTFTGGYSDDNENNIDCANHGGALYILGSLEMINCEFYDNESSTSGGLITVDCIIINNIADSSGGGISARTADITDCEISYNKSLEQAGGGVVQAPLLLMVQHKYSEIAQKILIQRLFTKAPVVVSLVLVLL